MGTRPFICRLGLLTGLSGPAAFFAMTASWPRYLGIAGAGLKQRAGFLCLWPGFGLLLFLLTQRQKE